MHMRASVRTAVQRSETRRLPGSLAAEASTPFCGKAQLHRNYDFDTKRRAQKRPISSGFFFLLLPANDVITGRSQHTCHTQLGKHQAFNVFWVFGWETVARRRTHTHTHAHRKCWTNCFLRRLISISPNFQNYIN